MAKKAEAPARTDPLDKYLPDPSAISISAPVELDPFDALSWHLRQIIRELSRELGARGEEHKRLQRARLNAVPDLNQHLVLLRYKANGLIGRAGLTGVSLSETEILLAPIWDSVLAIAQMTTAPEEEAGDHDKILADESECFEAVIAAQRRILANGSAWSHFFNLRQVAQKSLSSAMPLVARIRGALQHENTPREPNAATPANPSEQAKRISKLPPAQRKAVLEYLEAIDKLERLEGGPPVSWSALALTAGVPKRRAESWRKTAYNGLKAAGIPTFARPGGVKSRSAERSNGTKRKKAEIH